MTVLYIFYITFQLPSSEPFLRITTACSSVCYQNVNPFLRVSVKRKVYWDVAPCIRQMVTNRFRLASNFFVQKDQWVSCREDGYRRLLRSYVIIRHTTPITPLLLSFVFLLLSPTLSLVERNCADRKGHPATVQIRRFSLSVSGVLHRVVVGCVFDVSEQIFTRTETRGTLLNWNVMIKFLL